MGKIVGFGDIIARDSGAGPDSIHLAGNQESGTKKALCFRLDRWHPQKKFDNGKATKFGFTPHGVGRKKKAYGGAVNIRPRTGRVFT